MPRTCKLDDWRRILPLRRASACVLALILVFGATAWANTVHVDAFESGKLCAWSTTSGGPQPYLEAFSGADGSPWPVPWTAIGSVAAADMQGGRARFRPTPSFYSLARLYAPIMTRDVEVRFVVEFEDIATQGVGFYVRQNGGYLQQTSPHGQGYAVFVEGFRGSGIGVWRELDGVEQDLQILFDPALDFQNGVSYQVRFRVNQVDAATTLLQAKVWPALASEPTEWHVQVTDTTPQLQGISGGIALDSWSSIQSPNPITAHTLVDDIEVRELCNPLAGIGTLETVAETFQFTEGPLWRDNHLLFTDIDANTIYRLDPPAGISVFRTPSSQANGLALNPAGEILAAEHATRRVSRTEPTGLVVTLTNMFGGASYNSPNDLTVRSDGTVYFSDPDYGLLGARELAFNGLFSRRLDGTVVAEWEGVVGVNEPNGVALSANETQLFVSDSQTGELLVFDVAASGALSGRRAIASGLVIPDGMCVDRRGNVYVATWASTVEVFTADGIPWGAIPIPRQATNCAFGEDGRTLYVTAHEGLYRVRLTLAGIP